jgi:Glycosyltransferase family 87
MSARGQARRRSTRFAALAAGLAAALLAGGALMALHHPAGPAVSPAVAIRAALRDPMTRRDLAGSGWSSVQTEPLDPRLEHVSFFAHGQLVTDVIVEKVPAAAVGQGSRAEVLTGVDARRLRVPYGNWLAYQPALLVVLSALFVVMTAVSPWRRLRNLDVAVVVSLLGSMVLFQHRYIADSLTVAGVAMVYLGLRCAFQGLGPGAARGPSTPLLTAITPRLDAARRVRWLRVWLAVLVLAALMIGAGSPAAVDVLYAVMEGATKLVHGVLPYGHMPPGIVHSDTYPLLSYALYAPLAALAPVRDNWDSVDAGLAFGAAAALVCAWALFRLAAGGRGESGSRRRLEDEEAGLRSAFAWLAFPTLLATVSTGTTDIVLAAMLAGALLLWRRPTACSGLLAAAGWFKLAPFALLPVCLAPLRGRRFLAALAAIGGVSVPLAGLLLALGGTRGVGAMLHAMSYQFSRGAEQSVWGALGIEGLQPLAQACVLGLIAAAVVRLRQTPELAHDRARMAALAAAILIGIQLAADYWAFLYLVWIAPVLSASLLAQAGPAALDTQPIPQGIPQLPPAAALAGGVPR